MDFKQRKANQLDRNTRLNWRRYIFDLPSLDCIPEYPESLLNDELIEIVWIFCKFRAIKK